MAKIVDQIYSVTETVTEDGKTITKTHTTTSVVKTHIPTLIYVTSKEADVTTTKNEVQYTTITSTCPITYAPRAPRYREHLTNGPPLQTNNGY
jgi:hypothetical protein